MKRIIYAALAFCAFSCGAHAADEPQAAVWKSQDFTFNYRGFTSQYSCAGLQGKLTDVLLALGARKDDLKVEEDRCGADVNRLTPVATLKIKLSTLMPAPDGSAAPVATHWKRVNAVRKANYELTDCELVREVRRQLVPLFATRDLKFRDDGCVPNNTPTGVPLLTAEVLVADSMPR